MARQRNQRSERNPKISFKRLLHQGPVAASDSKERFVNHGLLVVSAMSLIHRGWAVRFEPTQPPEAIKQFLRTAGRGVLQGTLLELLWQLFEELEKEECA